MNGKRSKQIRRAAYTLSNKNSRGLLHEGKVEIFKKGDEGWYQRVMLRKHAADSHRKIYRHLKNLFTTGKISLRLIERYA